MPKDAHGDQEQSTGRLREICTSNRTDVHRLTHKTRDGSGSGGDEGSGSGNGENGGGEDGGGEGGGEGGGGGRLRRGRADLPAPALMIPGTCCTRDEGVSSYLAARV